MRTRASEGSIRNVSVLCSSGSARTADRAGFVLSHDLETATQVVKASDESSSAVSPDERFKELALFAVSPQYLEIRQRLLISVDS